MNGEKNYLKILFLSVGGTKACFNKIFYAISVQIRSPDSQSIAKVADFLLQAFSRMGL